MRTDPRPPLPARLRPAHWFALDVLAALAVAVVWSAPLVGGHSDAGPDSRAAAFAGLLGAALLAVPLALRRWSPLGAFVVGVPLFGLTLATSVVPVVPLASVPMALVTYSLAARGSRRTGLGALAVVVLLIAAAGPVYTGHWSWPRPAVLLPGLVVIVGWVVGRMAAQARAYRESLRRQRDREADAAVQRTVTEERLRIARDLHDVVAHSMSVITIQADMGRLVLDSKPAVAGAALGVIETTGRDALGELRRMLGILRAPDTESALGSLRPAPGLGDLDRLVAHAAAAGLEVAVTVTGEPRPLPRGVDLSAYRIVQEALTNVVKHAATPTCRLLLGYGPDAVTIDILDDGQGGSPRPGGHGLVGIRERAQLCGGECHAGPQPGGGFRVFVRLPSAACP
ncbi:sensor histidine kinase [Amycolatopsis sp. NPDC058278]|uniref:sensor histidine kinase n=1 Tax=Amycolatopsis sp. NPDC058278 TaxID=3346417 RepID=UPI0036D978DE